MSSVFSKNRFVKGISCLKATWRVAKFLFPGEKQPVVDNRTTNAI